MEGQQCSNYIKPNLLIYTFKWFNMHVLKFILALRKFLFTENCGATWKYYCSKKLFIDKRRKHFYIVLFTHAFFTLLYCFIYCFNIVVSIEFNIVKRSSWIIYFLCPFYENICIIVSAICFQSIFSHWELGLL